MATIDIITTLFKGLDPELGVVPFSIPNTTANITHTNTHIPNMALFLEEIPIAIEYIEAEIAIVA
ncbi:hypothetical protein ACJJIG_04335 [Microbulbifer sp. SSSA007]|uniref:hypothetical protein n=1 Tax=Microbulbifer sp. SSSA007 TaxID=3243379 RepID=UPI0040392089